MKLTFLGAAGEVTGSCYLVEDGDTKVLVDCGMFQSGRFSDNKNFEPLAFDPKSLAAVIITHAHIDHTGRIPKLIRDGFRGKIIATPPTLDFAYILLLDSEGLLKKEAKYNHHDPLYNIDDVETMKRHFMPLEYNDTFSISKNLSVTLRDAGHILGSSIVELVSETPKIKTVFSGDLGNSPILLLRPKTVLTDADYLVVESTYGDRLHEDLHVRKDRLEDIIEETVGRGGVLLIPAFAMERTQEILFEINELVEHHRIPPVPVFLDSPLAITATSIYRKYNSYYNSEINRLISEGDDIFHFKGLRLTETTEESKQINTVPAPKVIIAGSGMSNGGRILHHEKLYLSDPKNTLLIIGFQVHGSLGRQLVEGAKKVRIFDEEITVRAQVQAIGGYSAHADQHGILRWVEPMRATLKNVFITHGEAGASEVLRQHIRDEFALQTTCPAPGTVFNLEGTVIGDFSTLPPKAGT